MAEFLQKHLTLALFSFAAKLSPAGQNRLAGTIANLLWYSKSSTRSITEINIALCFPTLSENERKVLAKDSVFHTVMTAVEIPGVWTRKPEQSLTHIVEIEGQSLLDEAQKAGKGVVVIAPHLGNWEYLGLFLGRHYPTTSLYKPPKQAWLEEITRKGRGSTGANLMPTNKKGVLAVLKALKAGGVTGILPDQIPDKGNGAAYVPFFGHTVATMTLIPSLLQRGNVVAVAAFCQRLAPGKFKLVFRPAPADVYAEDEIVSATALNQAVEELVTIAPEQYQWEYKRFRRGVDGKKLKHYQ